MSNLTYDEQKKRALLLAEYIIKSKSTVRAAAARFGISKSTVHKDLTEKLPDIDSAAYGKVKKILETNKRERHIRGGLATKHKYEEMGKKPNRR
ncbi:MAG: sporulation transcriptional regulator SpoIIID [Ruminococcus sp.]|nr:sporulation transcriptional regulator SpoIIID [Ruminococcus sp.]